MTVQELRAALADYPDNAQIAIDDDVHLIDGLRDVEGIWLADRTVWGRDERGIRPQRKRRVVVLA